MGYRHFMNPRMNPGAILMNIANKKSRLHVSFKLYKLLTFNSQSTHPQKVEFTGSAQDSLQGSKAERGRKDELD